MAKEACFLLFTTLKFILSESYRNSIPNAENAIF